MGIGGDGASNGVALMKHRGVHNLASSPLYVGAERVRPTCLEGTQNLASNKGFRSRASEVGPRTRLVPCGADPIVPSPGWHCSCDLATLRSPPPASFSSSKWDECLDQRHQAANSRGGVDPGPLTPGPVLGTWPVDNPETLYRLPVTLPGAPDPWSCQWGVPTFCSW